MRVIHPLAARRMPIVLLALAAAVGCRSEQRPSEPPEPIEAESDSAKADGRDEADEAVPAGAATADTPETSGYGLAGAETCLPLEADRRCLVRPDPVLDACAAANGVALRCDDCRVLCSVALGK